MIYARAGIGDRAESGSTKLIRAASIHDIFFYPSGCRPVLHCSCCSLATLLSMSLGLSDAAFRVMPLLLALVGVAAMFALSLRIAFVPVGSAGCGRRRFLSGSCSSIPTRLNSTIKEKLAAALPLFLLCAAVRYLQETMPHRNFRWLVVVAVVAHRRSRIRLRS